MPVFQGRGSPSVLQLGHERLCRCPVAEALARLVVQVSCEVNEISLRNSSKVRVSWHETANALVGVFYASLLPWGTRVAEPAARTNSFFQSPEPGKLCTPVKCEALTRERRQRRKRSDDLVHDRPRVPARVLYENGVAALTLHQSGDIGMAEWAFENEEVSLPMSKP